MPVLERIFLYLLMFIGLPGVVFFFVRAIQRDKTEVDRLKARKDVLELEVRKEEAKAKALEAENRKYDRIIEEAGKTSPPSAGDVETTEN
ncbi:MAG TPA: hypothetical protein VMV44_02915 [Rectinemataceae bacterium]|nr:hypothetical protein [Rectinemataceae bacterium]